MKQVAQDLLQLQLEKWFQYFHRFHVCFNVFYFSSHVLLTIFLKCFILKGDESLKRIGKHCSNAFPWYFPFVILRFSFLFLSESSEAGTYRGRCSCEHRPALFPPLDAILAPWPAFNAFGLDVALKRARRVARESRLVSTNRF